MTHCHNRVAAGLDETALSACVFVGRSREVYEQVQYASPRPNRSEGRRIGTDLTMEEHQMPINWYEATLAVGALERPPPAS